MRLRKGGRRSREPLLIGQRDIARIPACARPDTSRVLEGREEFVPQKRHLRAIQRIPLPCVDIRNAFVDRAPHQLPTPPASMRSRNLSASRAAMQPEPADVTA